MGDTRLSEKVVTVRVSGGLVTQLAAGTLLQMTVTPPFFPLAHTGEGDLHRLRGGDR